MSEQKSFINCLIGAIYYDCCL